RAAAGTRTAAIDEVLGEIRKLLPFALLGLDTDNDSVFMNETVRDYCLAADVEFTRCLPYRKNDQAGVEQKNGSVVRRVSATGASRGCKPPRCWRDCTPPCGCS